MLISLEGNHRGIFLKMQQQWQHIAAETYAEVYPFIHTEYIMSNNNSNRRRYDAQQIEFQFFISAPCDGI